MEKVSQHRNHTLNPFYLSPIGIYFVSESQLSIMLVYTASICIGFSKSVFYDIIVAFFLISTKHKQKTLQIPNNVQNPHRNAAIGRKDGLISETCCFEK